MHSKFLYYLLSVFFVILDTLVKNTDSFVCGTSKLVAISQVIFFSNCHWILLEAIHNDTL